METNLTSLETYLYKYMLPIFFIPWDGFRTVRGPVRPDNPGEGMSFWLFLAFWVVMTPFVFRYSFKLKRVTMDERSLYVKGYLKEARIPFSNVESITPSRWPNLRHVTLRLKTASEFGTKIMFIPRKRIATPRGEVLTVEELMRRIG
jgi:hypothetical protein